jgi:hypothetical protein
MTKNQVLQNKTPKRIRYKWVRGSINKKNFRKKIYVILLYLIYVEIKFQYGTIYFKLKFFVLNLGDRCSCTYAKEITILFCKQIGRSPNTSYAKCRMGLRERKMEMVGNSFGSRPMFVSLTPCRQVVCRPDKIAIRQGWGTLVVSAKTQKSRFEDLEWSSVAVVSS